MTMLGVVRELQAKGHNVKYYVRKDGGILIKSIDSNKFTGAKGNALAREMVNVKLSEARSHQLKYATRSRKKIRARRKKGKMTLDDKIKSEYDRVKRKWNKAFKSKNGQPHPAGYFGWERIQWSIEHYGKSEALRRISEAEKYASGIAYSKNVEELVVFIRLTADMKNSQLLKDVANDLEDNAYMIRDEWIQPAYDELYTINQGAKIEDVARNLRKILRLSL